MRAEIEQDDIRGAILTAGEGDAAFVAWTLEELQDDLDALRSAFAGSDDPGG